jgi:DNA-binding transcriptional LysR family regulator
MARIDWYLRAGLKMRHLRMLVALDNHRQTNKVAAVLNVTQPAISKTLTDLELRLGMKLFDRHARGLVPTPLGDCLIRGARAMLGDLADTGEELDALAHGVLKTIRVGALPASASSLIPTCLTRLKELAPSTRVFVREATMDSLVSELRSGAIELIVGVLSDRQSHRDLKQEVLFADKTTFVVRRGHALSLSQSLDLVSLAGYPWVLPPAQSMLGESLYEWFQECGMPHPTNVIETLSVSVIRRYVTDSDAIATIPASIALEPHWARDLHVLPLSPPPLVRPVGMTWHRDRPLTPGAQLFMTCMRSTAGQSATAEAH